MTEFKVDKLGWYKCEDNVDFSDFERIKKYLDLELSKENTTIVLYGYTLPDPDFIYYKHGSFVIAKENYINPNGEKNKKWKIIMEEIIE